MMNELMIFIDGSVHAQSKIGFGASLGVSDIGLSLDVFATQIKIKQFENTSSTQLELQNFLWAINTIPILGRKVIVYTDSQTIVRLPSRREKLELNLYRSSQNIRLNQAELYQAFYRTIDTVDCHFIKVKGHQKAQQKVIVDHIFSLVDRASRQALRRYHQQLTKD